MNLRLSVSRIRSRISQDSLPSEVPQVEQIDNGTERPGDRVDPDRQQDIVVNLSDRHQRHHTHSAPAGQHDYGRHHRLAYPPHHGGAYMRKAAEAEEKAADLSAQRAVMNDLRIRVKEGHKLRAKEDHEGAERLHHKDRGDQTETDSLPHAALFSGAEVLCHEGAHGHGKSVDRQEDEALKLCRCADAGHRHLAEGVDVGLDHHVGEVDHAGLQRCRQADLNDLHELPAVKADLLRLKTDHFVRLQQAPHHQGSTHKLADDGRKSRAFHTHMQEADEAKVKDCVQHRAEDQVIERVLGIAARLQNADEQVVKDQPHTAGKIDA